MLLEMNLDLEDMLRETRAQPAPAPRPPQARARTAPPPRPHRALTALGRTLTRLENEFGRIRPVVEEEMGSLPGIQNLAPSDKLFLWMMRRALRRFGREALDHLFTPVKMAVAGSLVVGAGTATTVSAATLPMTVCSLGLLAPVSAAITAAATGTGMYAGWLTGMVAGTYYAGVRVGLSMYHEVYLCARESFG